MKIALLLFGIILIWVVIRKIEIKWRKKQKDKQKTEKKIQFKHEILKELKTMKKFDMNGYEKETAEEIRKINEKIDSCIEEVIDNKFEKGKISIDELKKETELFSKRMSEAHKKIEEVLKGMEIKVEYIKNYTDNTNFYPPNFALDNNKLNGMIVEINDKKRKNPLIKLDDYVDFSEKLYEQVLVFRKQHKEVVSLIETIEIKQSEFPVSKRNRIMELKNDLYIKLHKGEAEETKKTIQELKAIIK